MPAIRLFDRTTGTALVVDTAARAVRADLNGDGSIGAAERLGGKDAEAALAAAVENEKLFEVAVPGTQSSDGRFDVRGPLSQKEERALAAGGAVPGERSALTLHLDFFDRDRDGSMSLSENYGGFRAAGFSVLGAGVKAALSALIFGKAKDGFAIDVDRIGEKRYATSTGIYDKNGRIDERRLGEFLARFDEAGRPLTSDEVMTLLNDKAQGQGVVSKGQFKSLFTVCKRLNKGADVVTKDQFRGLFDGSLLWLAASAADADGRRRL